MSIVRSTSALIGREHESRALTERIHAASRGAGGALVVRGAPGIGKTSVLDGAKAEALSAGLRILTTTGVQSETHLPFAGLHQLLGPVMRDIDRLPVRYAKALQSAFGLIEEPVDGSHLVAMSMLHLLGESAEHGPIALLVDDAQWLDGSSTGALTFVARRLESDPIVLIIALRDGFDSPFLEAGLPELALGTLTDAQAQSLLDARSPHLDSALRDRVLRSAAGNPLALIELATALRSGLHADRALHGAGPPLTARLERAFADRLDSLDTETRAFLRVAAASDSGRLDELLAATSRLAGREISLDVATRARTAGLIEVEGLEMHFRHPLMRSAIHQATSLEDRRSTHAALAETLAGDPDRGAWHRVAAATGTRDEIAAELDGIRARAYKRSAVTVAMEAAVRGAEYAVDPQLRGKLLMRAATYAWIMGSVSDVQRLLDMVDPRELPAPSHVFYFLLCEEFGRSRWTGGPEPIRKFLEAAEEVRSGGNVDSALSMYLNASDRCWWTNADDATRAAVASSIRQVDIPPDDFRVMILLALTDPMEYGPMVLDYLSGRTEDPKADARAEPLKLAMASRAVGDFARAERFMEINLAYCRSNGILGWLGFGLQVQAWNKIVRNDWRTAESLATECVRLGTEAGPENLVGAANLACATIAAYRGDVDTAERLIVEGASVYRSSGPDPHLAFVQWPRGVAALASGRFEEAYQALNCIFDASDVAYHAQIRNWVLVDLVEAAVHSGHETEARAIVQELQQVVERSCSPQLQAALLYAGAALSPDDDEGVFQITADLAHLPFTRARLQLAHGIWLRRQRRAADSRIPLRAARDTFDALGAVPWGERARQELRASGETSRRRSHDLIDALSPQELQIARMAADGMSNKEIGRQLFLSHRTIGSHLYRIFPKLGITARVHLRDALQGRSAAPTDA